MKRIRQLFKPRKDFVRKTRNVFLTAFRERFPSSKTAPGFAWRYFARGAAMGAAVTVIVSGTSVYADQANVGPESILYPLKRAQEVVNLIFTPENDRPALHLEFAERRFEEVEAVKTKDPENPRLITLIKDLKKEIRESLKTIENGDEEEKERETSAATAAEEEKEEGKQPPQKILPPSQEMKTSSPLPSRGKEIPFAEEEDDAREIKAPRAAPLPEKESEKKSGAPAPLREKPSFRRGDAAICEKWRNLLVLGGDDGLKDIEQLADEYPEILKKFEKKCAPLAHPETP